VSTGWLYNIKVGKRRKDGSQTFLLQIIDKHENTLYIELSQDGSYWNVNSAEIFGKGYSAKKKKQLLRPNLNNRMTSLRSTLRFLEIRLKMTQHPKNPTVSQPFPKAKIQQNLKPSKKFPKNLLKFANAPEIDILREKRRRKHQDGRNMHSPRMVCAVIYDHEELETRYREIEPVKKDGHEVSFPYSAFKKNYRPGGLFEKIVPDIREIFEGSVLMDVEKDQLAGTERRDGTKHKEHVHSTFVSNIELYNNPAKNQAIPAIRRGNLKLDEIVDAKLQNFFESARKSAENSSKIIDKNGEPLVVYHGSRTGGGFNVFDGNN